MTKYVKLSALMVALLASTGAMAHDTHGYTISEQSGEIVRNNYGECWENNYLNKEVNGLVECGDRAAPAPAPQPQVPVARRNERISLGSDALFAFDKDALRSEAAGKLDAEIVAKLRNPSVVAVEAVRVVGHTDFMGSESYNQGLSQRRAQTVANYLASQGVNVNEVVGAGESQAQKTAACQAEVNKLGRRVSQAKRRTALIACIADDRRVDVEVQYLQRAN